MAKILIVDDDPHLREVLNILFKQEGYETIKVESGEEALLTVDIESPDLMILDVSMGEGSLNGFDVLKEIRESGNTVPVILLTALSEEEGIVRGFSEGADDYISKPFRARELLARVQRRLQAKSPNEFSTGSLIQGKDIYEIIGKIREGGMGVVYKAKRKKDGELVAAKFLHPHCLVNKKEVERFKREGEVSISLCHTNLAKGYEVIVSPTQCCLIMEFVNGETVGDILDRQQLLPPQVALDIVIQVTKALECISRSGLVHRDVKPDNIIITPQNIAKLVDFGLTKSINQNMTLTTHGIILGTPYYLSPEQARGEFLDIRSDIYSLGTSFYHMVTGKIPFEGVSTIAIINARLHKDPEAPDVSNPSLSQGFSHVIRKMMARNKLLRYKSPEELLEALSKLKLQL